MTSIKVNAHVGADGILKLNVPVGLTDTDLEVVLVVAPLAPALANTNRDWPKAFMDKFAGAAPDFPERAPQGEYELREGLGGGDVRPFTDRTGKAGNAHRPL